MDAISSRLVALRKESGMSMKAVAQLISVSPSTYRDWEYGNSIKIEPYVRLAKLFKCSLSYLLTGASHEEMDILKRIENIRQELDSLIEEMNIRL